MINRTVIITGATGILGRALILRLLKTNLNIIALVRARGNEEGSNRLIRILDIPQLDLHNRLTTISADLTLPLLGMSQENYDDLRAKASLVIHCAGDVSFNEQDKERIFNINVNGTRNILSFASSCLSLNCFLHISTAYVCGNAKGLIFEDSLGQGQTFSTPYEESKFQAEQLVELFRDQYDIPTIICRPSIILEGLKGMRLTRLPAINALILLLDRVVKSIPRGTFIGKTIRILADEGAVADLVPIDYVTECVVKLLLEPKAYGGTYHITNPASPQLRDIVRIISEVIDNGNYKFQCVNPEKTSIHDLNSAEKMLLMNIQPYLSHLSTKFYFDNSNVKPLRKLGILPKCPIISKEVIANLVRDSIQYATP